MKSNGQPEELSEELADKIKKEDIQNKKYINAISLLLESNEFKIYCEFLQKQINARRVTLSRPVYDAQSQMLHNFTSGEVAGLELAIRLPDEMKEKQKEEEGFNNALERIEKNEG